MGEKTADLILADIDAIGTFDDIATDKLLAMNEEELKKLLLIKEIQEKDVNMKCRLMHVVALHGLVKITGEYINDVTEFLLRKPDTFVLPDKKEEKKK